jgi:hypothetical protein
MHIHSTGGWQPTTGRPTTSSAASGNTGFDVASATGGSTQAAPSADPISSLLSTLSGSVQDVLTNLQQAGGNTGPGTSVASPLPTNNGAASLSAMLGSYQAAAAQGAASALTPTATSLTV